MQLRMSSIGTLSLQAGHRDIWEKIGTVLSKLGHLTCLAMVSQAIHYVQSIILKYLESALSNSLHQSGCAHTLNSIETVVMVVKLHKMSFGR